MGRHTQRERGVKREGGDVKDEKEKGGRGRVLERREREGGNSKSEARGENSWEEPQSMNAGVRPPPMRI